MSDNKKTNYLVVIYKISNTWFFERYSRGLADIPIKLPYNQSQLNFMAFLGQPYEYYHFILINGKKERFLKKLKKAVQKASDQYSVGKMVKGIDKFL